MVDRLAACHVHSMGTTVARHTNGDLEKYFFQLFVVALLMSPFCVIGDGDAYLAMSRRY